MEYKEILREEQDGILTLTFNRPEQMNALSFEMVEELYSALIEARNDPAVRVLILTGAGRAFCAGGDVKAMAQRHAEQPAMETTRGLRHGMQRMAPTLRALGKPAIAAVNGAATGAGCDLALACDIRIAADNARFAESYVNVALVPGAGGAWLLPRIVGMSKAAELLFTGDIINAQEAERIGMVSKVVPVDQLMSAAKELAAKLAAKPPLSLRAIKTALHSGQEMQLEALLEQVSLAFGSLSKTEDHQEAARAFIEKRAPKFKGI